MWSHMLEYLNGNVISFENSIFWKKDIFFFIFQSLMLDWQNASVFVSPPARFPVDRSQWMRPAYQRHLAGHCFTALYCNALHVREG